MTERKTLRQLAREYAGGELHQDTYRKERAKLLDGILKGEVPVSENEYLAPILSVPEDDLDTTERKPDRAAHPDAGQAPPPPPPRRSVMRLREWAIGGGVAVLLLVLAAIFVFSADDEATDPAVSSTAGDDGSQTTTATSRTGTDVYQVDPAAASLLQEFLADNNWSESSIDQLQAEWSTLDPVEQATARGSITLKRMADAIHRRLLEERALAGLGNTDDSMEKQRLLVSLARQLGINDNRISVQEPARRQGATVAPTSPEAPAPRQTGPQQTAGETPDPPASAATAAVESDTPAERPANGDQTVPATAEIEDETPVSMETSASSFSPVQEQPREAEIVPATGPETASAAARGNDQGACNPSLLRSRRPYCRDRITGVGDGPTMVAIPPGEFMMGGTETHEQPVHRVEIEYPFAISVHEITYGEFQQFCNDTGTSCPDQPWTGKDYPVVNVNWGDAVAYTEWLSEKTGQDYRLPSEAEWEYAARGGTDTAYPFGDDIDISYAVFSYQSKLSSPLPKTDRSINRNPFRLYHIVGNIREWVTDSWFENYQGAPVDGSARVEAGNPYRVVRGGSYADDAHDLRSAARMRLAAETADSYTGFRVIQEM